MKTQYENKVMSSLLLFVDHEVTQKGDAYTNHGSAFYKIDSLFSDYYVYASPYKQLVSDTSVAATVSVSTITEDSGTATATTSTNHLLRTGDTVVISGADQSAYNASFVVTVTGNTTFTFSIAPGTGAVSGTIVVVKKPEVLTGIYFSAPGTTDFTEGPMFVQSGTPPWGFDSINHMQGQLYFTGDSDPVGGSGISGSYAIKEFNVFLTSMPEEQLLFETKLALNPRTSDANPTVGMEANAQSYPAIFIKDNGGTSEEFALGGVEDTIVNARAIVLADSMFSLDATCGILKDTVRKNMPIVTQTGLSLNALGGFTGVNYNYTDTATEGYCYIDRVTVSKNIANRGDFENLNPNVFSAFVDLELHTHRMPRL